MLKLKFKLRSIIFLFCFVGVCFAQKDDKILKVDSIGELKKTGVNQIKISASELTGKLKSKTDTLYLSDADLPFIFDRWYILSLTPEDPIFKSYVNTQKIKIYLSINSTYKDPLIANFLTRWALKITAIHPWQEYANMIEVSSKLSDKDFFSMVNDAKKYYRDILFIEPNVKFRKNK
ncbi:MAG: hypothetical protein EBS07_12225 [Sphingobacteriia bacterium]|nr:hypothetical protein [Sphingobacteriia bacterium]